MTAVIVVAILFILILSDVPVAFALALSGFGFLFFATDIPLVILPQRMFMGIDSFALISAPLFIFAGLLMNRSGLSNRLIDFASAMFGHFKGGLAIINVVASMLFAGISGTAMADTAAVGGVLVPAMIKRGYARDFTGAITAASSTIGIIIPPSVPMILYGVLVGLSVTTLFIAGIIPGIIIGILMIGVAVVTSMVKGYGSDAVFSWRTLWKTFYAAIPALVLPLIILGGIIGGIFTPTEAAGVAVVYVIVHGLFIGRDLSLSYLWATAKETIIITGSIMILIAASNLMGWAFSYARIPQLLVTPLLNITQHPAAFLWIVSAVLIVAGTFMHGTAMLAVIVPLVLPTAELLGINPFQLAMVVIMCWGIGQQTPPVGSALFITCTLAEQDMWQLTRANVPFIATLILVLALIIHVPQWVVFPIPRLLGLM